MNETTRVGLGTDIHPFTEGRKLILGGVEIPHTHGLHGHSDADALTHAICDALLGALALGDIGMHFPDSDEQYKNISSIRLLEQVGKLLMQQGYRPVNIDSMLILEKPRIAPFVPQMRENIASALGIPVDRISVKATTSERLGFTGRKEGILAQAVALVERAECF